MARKHTHEEHANHEAWAIPYGDLVTLLLAFFVVMYAISSVNEGKYRVLADALSSAFGGQPRTIAPVTVGNTQLRGAAFDRPSLQTAAAKSGPTSPSPVNIVHVRQSLDMPTFGRRPQDPAEAARARQARDRQLNAIGRRISEALSALVKQRLVTVRRGDTFLEVEIQSDILFASGVAEPGLAAKATVRKLAGVLREEPNAVRVEGYTDDRPISTAQFQSNWELSAARAASVVHVLTGEGVSARRLAVVGYGEHQPVADNATESGRNANRRVLLVILAAPDGPDAVSANAPTLTADAASAPPDPAAPVAHVPQATPASGTAPTSSRPRAHARSGANGDRDRPVASASVAPPLATAPGAG